MSTEKSTPSNEPFIAQTDRPELKLTPDTPLSELRVRDLAAILGQHSKQGDKRSNAKSGEKYSVDKSWGEKYSVDKSWGEKYTIEKSGEAPIAATSQQSLQQAVEDAGLTPQVSSLKSRTAELASIDFHGGEIVSRPLVYASFWGKSWKADLVHQNLAEELTQFHKDLLRSNFMNVLTQYVGNDVLNGEFVHVSYEKDVRNVLKEANEYEKILENIIKKAKEEAKEKAKIDKSPRVMVIYLDEKTSIQTQEQQLNFSWAQDWGFHSHHSIDGDELYYCFVAYSRNVDFGTYVASHEFAEMITDPECDAWKGIGDIEIGDVCEGQCDIIIVGQNRWRVQKIYSVVHGRCIGQLATPAPVLPRKVQVVQRQQNARRRA